MNRVLILCSLEDFGIASLAGYVTSIIYLDLCAGLKEQVTPIYLITWMVAHRIIYFLLSYAFKIS